jgi:hypothetical protein
MRWVIVIIIIVIEINANLRNYDENILKHFNYSKIEFAFIVYFINYL